MKASPRHAAGLSNCGDFDPMVMTMSMTFSAGGGGDFKRLEAGAHVAVCDMVVLMGLQPGSAQYPKPKLKVYIRWQVAGERTDDDRPMVVGATLTASMNEKAQLRKLLEGWRGEKFTDEAAEAFDVAKLIGKPCMVSVVESESGGKTYSNVASVSKLPKGLPAPALEGEALVYWNRDDAADQAVFRKLPDWLQKKIASQLEPQREPARDEHAFVDDDLANVPF